MQLCLWPFWRGPRGSEAPKLRNNRTLSYLFFFSKKKKKATSERGGGTYYNRASGRGENSVPGAGLEGRSGDTAPNATSELKPHSTPRPQLLSRNPVLTSSVLESLPEVLTEAETRTLTGPLPSRRLRLQADPVELVGFGVKLR